MNPSDRKKLLALPFYLAKRAEQPEPRMGQKEFDLFKELTGKNWHDNDGVLFDPEHKVTEFDYENYFPAELLKTVNTKDEEFKQFIRALNLYSKTQYE